MDTTDAPQIIEHIHKGINFTPYDVKFVPCSARIVAMGIHSNAKVKTFIKWNIWYTMKY